MSEIRGEWPDCGHGWCLIDWSMNWELQFHSHLYNIHIAADAVLTFWLRTMASYIGGHNSALHSSSSYSVESRRTTSYMKSRQETLHLYINKVTYLHTYYTKNFVHKSYYSFAELLKHISGTHHIFKIIQQLRMCLLLCNRLWLSCTGCV